MKFKVIKKILTIKAAFVCLFGVSLFFFFDTQLDGILGKHLRVYPSFTGGEVAEDFVETIDDTDSLDFVRYTVFLPVINAKWVDNSEYWQLVLEYKNGSEPLKNDVVVTVPRASFTSWTWKWLSLRRRMFSLFWKMFFPRFLPNMVLTILPLRLLSGEFRTLKQWRNTALISRIFVLT